MNVQQRVAMFVILSVIITALAIPIVEHGRRQQPPRTGNYELLPAPWLVPKKAGETALRLAMIHDVLHERFYIHGSAWFEHRHAQVERELATYDDGSKPKDARYFTLLDDLAVDFDRLGKPAEGIPILRRKLDLQQPLGADGKRPAPAAQFYTTYANLGTLLAHQHLKGALAKDPEALAGLREGLAFIEQSVAVNPNAHFGRERWQVVTLRYLLHASERPEFLTLCDLTGVEWGDPSLQPHDGYPYDLLRQLRDDEAFSKRLVNGPRDLVDDQIAEQIRRSIPRVQNYNQEWIDRCGQYLQDRFRFDEPALAMVGIWTLGSGANPHFALAFAHLMESHQQHQIAWNAYERTSELAQKFWSDPVIQEKLLAHCREKQASLEARIKIPAEKLREQHRTELAYGRAEQAAYQTYEAEQIAVGKAPLAPGFYADFFRDRKPIASDPGEADTVVYKKSVERWVIILWVQAILCSIATLSLIISVIRRQRELAA
jgi:hypothetical protein